MTPPVATIEEVPTASEEQTGTPPDAEHGAPAKDDVLTWIVDKNGKAETTDFQPKTLTGKIVVKLKLSEENDERTVYTSNGFIKDGRAWKSIVPKNEQAAEYKTDSEAFEAAWEHLKSEVDSRYEEALSGKDIDKAVELNLLRNVMRDQFDVEKIRIKASKVVRFTYAEGTQLLFALRELRQRFKDLDRDAPIAVRFRHEETGEGPAPWAGGKDRFGNTLLVQSKAEKVSKANAELLRAKLGYAPLFLITVCGLQWCEMEEQERRRVLHEAFYRCCYNDEKAWISDETPKDADVIDLFGLNALPRERRNNVQHLIDTLREREQLDLFLSGEGGEQEEHHEETGTD